ncbi:hypothetical protein, partial [Rugosimonospora africana]|uniref:hypothetical protein n=1 Tax=Rugosimonospora africana TaxID=556532 RepID=UPI00194379D9
GAALWGGAVGRRCGAALWGGAVGRRCGAALWSRSAEPRRQPDPHRATAPRHRAAGAAPASAAERTPIDTDRFAVFH